jgi:tRNA/rRNA methyltransferase
MNDATFAASLPAPAIILVEPQMGENIGAASRVMANFGLSDLRLINPRGPWPNPKAQAMAAGATTALDAARLHGDAASTTADLTLILATTGAPRDQVREVIGPAEAVRRMRDEIARGGRPGVLFGPERTGLTTEWIHLSHAIVTYPVDAAFTSLNLAQAVAVLAYAWRADADDAALSRWQAAGAPAPATRATFDRLTEHLFAELEVSNFFWPEDKAVSLRRTLAGALQRARLGENEIHALHGAIKALVGGPRRRTVAAREAASLERARAVVEAARSGDAARFTSLLSADASLTRNGAPCTPDEFMAPWAGRAAPGLGPVRAHEAGVAVTLERGTGERAIWFVTYTNDLVAQLDEIAPSTDG